jgi:PKHD-type hydroxylase
MFFVIPDLLTPEEVQRVRNKIDAGHFVAGAGTAANPSSAAKNNLQISYQDTSQHEARDIIEKAFARNSMFQFLALPKTVAPPTFNRYDEGMYYKDHIDHALIGGEHKVRGDISTTVFLTNPREYAGGELVLQFDGQELPVKLEAGQAVVYSATLMHRVNPVTRGSRIAAVTSIQSTIKNAEQRDLMGDLARVMRWTQDIAPDAPENQVLMRVYNNLLRMWAEI